MQLFDRSEAETEEHPPTNPDRQVKDDSMKPNSSNSTSNSGFIPVLLNVRFLILWIGQIFSQLADKLYFVLAIAIIDDSFPNITTLNPESAFMIAFTIPAVLFGSLAGVYVNRWPKKRVLVISNLLRGLFVLTIPPLLWLSKDAIGFFNLPAGFLILLGITLVVSTLTQFFAPAEQSTIPLIVKKQHLLPANSIYATTMMASLLGFAIGDAVLNWSDRLLENFGLMLSSIVSLENIDWNFGKEVFVGGSYIIAGLVLILLAAKETEKDLQTEQTDVFQDIWDGVLYLGENLKVRNALIQLILLYSVFATLPVLATALADQIPDMTKVQFGRLIAAGGVGIGCVAAIIGHLVKRFSSRHLSIVGLLGVSASFIGLSLATQAQWLALSVSALLGGFAALVIVPMQTTVQAETPPDMRGKVFGLQNNLVNIALALPLALVGISLQSIGLQPTCFGLAAIVLFAGIVIWNLPSDRAVRSNKVDKSGR